MSSTLNARPREESGKSAARALRRTGEVPGVVYGHGDQTRSVSINTLELEKLLSAISVENTVIDLAIGSAKTPALIREVQYHPARPQILHIDFYQVHAGQKLHVEVPVRLNGNPIGVRDLGGVMQEVLHVLSVECLPRDIPQGIDVDVEALTIGDSVHVRDVEIANVRILNDGDLVICTVTAPTTGALEEGAGKEEDVGGDVQPELVRRAPGADEAS